MTLDQVQDNHTCEILSLKAEAELLNRLLSFGFTRGKLVKKLKSSLINATIAVELDNACVILRASEAKFIEVRE